MNYSARKYFFLIFSLVCSLTATHSQTFINLDFEHPILPLNPVDFQVTAAQAIPGWTAYDYGNASLVVYNTISLGSAAVSLQGPGSLEPIIQGNYSVILQGSSASTPSSAAIGQTGQVPADAKTLTFSGFFLPADVLFNGQPLLSIVASATPNYNNYAADISAFAGQTGQLLFTAPLGYMEEIDNIAFSPNSVPEPQIWSLLLCATTALALKRRPSKP